MIPWATSNQGPGHRPQSPISSVEKQALVLAGGWWGLSLTCCYVIRSSVQCRGPGTSVARATLTTGRGQSREPEGGYPIYTCRARSNTVQSAYHMILGTHAGYSDSRRPIETLLAGASVKKKDEKSKRPKPVGAPDWITTGSFEPRLTKSCHVTNQQTRHS